MTSNWKMPTGLPPMRRRRPPHWRNATMQRCAADRGGFPRPRRGARNELECAMNKANSMALKRDPWTVPVAVAQIPDTGLHRDIEAGQAVREAMAELAGLREILSASASLDVTPRTGGRVHVVGRVRARVGQTCVVSLEPIENDLDEAIDLIFAPPDQIPQLADLVDEAAETEGEIPDPPEPIENGMIDLGRLATDALFLGVDP